MPKAEEIHYLIYTQKSPAPQWKEKKTPRSPAPQP